MSGKVAGGGNRVIRPETAAVMATQPDDIADKQQRRAGKGRKGWRRWAEEPQFARQPDHDQSHGDKSTYRPA
ncbi:hypothetical protein LTSEALA_5070 [Salmonella enterica subsp. enterica serovar Alachua str. R6-377]|uniref:Uncharacterized protein n=1 Tax=Salmonella enterica subsp. enterica serovar Alachua str. R6-377 TaxID=913241 RepID=G5LV00_SALET|nr:hypothetical protein LTSEALA_5070 [Salmonella enterica subsp. enterica serovar Alachua str. R6-377]